MSSAEKKLKDFTAGRGTLRRRVLKSQTYLDSLDPETVSSVELELVEVDIVKHNEDYDKIYEGISDLCDDTAFAPHDVEFDYIKSILIEITKKHMQLKNNITIATPPPSPQVSKPSFKLEKIKMPSFNGEMGQWQNFRDLFETAIHNNPNLSEVEKLTHLKTSLVGAASKVVSSFVITAANYAEAWKCVYERYDNVHEIVRAHLRKLDECKSLSFESATGLRDLSDSLKECIRSLKAIKVNVRDNDVFPIYLTVKKLDTESQKQWSLLQTANLPKISELVEFLESRARALAHTSSKIQQQGYDKKKSNSHHTSSTKNKNSCIMCKESHYLGSCKLFQDISLPEKKQFVTKNNLCFNCLMKGHGVSSCTSKGTCRKCNGKHHTQLHFANQNKKEDSSANSSSSSSSTVPNGNSSEIPQQLSTAHCTLKQSGSKITLLGTLSAYAYDSAGRRQLCRIFVDQGSESTFISERLVTVLGLKRKKSCITFTGVGDSQSQSTKGRVELNLYSRLSNFFIQISAFILPKLTNPMPSSSFSSEFSELKSLQLGDPLFNVQGHIDILLGVKYHVPILLPEIKYGSNGSPHAQNTQFGWMLSGEISTARLPSKVSTYHVSCSNSEICIQDSLQKFWELEEPSCESVLLSGEEEECENHFITTHVKNADGTYTVQLPFKKNAPALGESRNSAINRFLKVEARISKNPEIKKQYIEQIQEYLNLNYMEKIPSEEIIKPNGSTYYLPHREVIKPSSSTTKCRIVYDASAKSSNGISLNDILHTGPKLQIDLIPLLIRFRSHQIAMSADIVKFYPQFKVDKPHTDFQRLIWRENSNDQLEDYRMLRVTFGITSAPYLAIRCLHQLANDQENSFPLASPVLKEDFLVDNLLSGTTDIKSALHLQQQIIQICKAGNLQLRKWASNNEEILSAVPAEHRECKIPLPIEETEAVKTIGILWLPTSDSFSISISVPNHHTATKRKVLSAIAKIFDPLGWLSPVTVRPKILLQEMWKLKLDWDSPLPFNLQQHWSKYCEELQHLKEFSIPRCISRSPGSNLNFNQELHGFCDASQEAYAACVYSKCIDEDNNVIITLIAAKTKVAPVKKETIPRLELCSAVLLTKLMKTIQESTHANYKVIRCWTDSEIVLSWLNSNKTLKVFEANRVRKIITLFPPNQWSHVSGLENPADPASRGISATKLLNHPNWLHGPSWLSTVNVKDSESTSYTVQSNEDDSLLINIINANSSFVKLKRIIAYILRFSNNCKKNGKSSGSLTTEELSKALILIIKAVQATAFQNEIIHLARKEVVKSNVKFLCPFLDSNGIIRVGGRLQQTDFPYNKKHPMLLPSHHHFTNILVRHLHLTNLHATPNLLLAICREQFWIVRGQDVVKRIVKQCVICHKYNSSNLQQIMGQLPTSRVTPAKPFNKTGVDFAGPFLVCLKKGRNPKYVKSYVCVFVCMSTKAVHLELVLDLSTASYIAALSRFIARRGLPSDIYSDGGLNFIGAKNEITDIINFLTSITHNSQITDFLSPKAIKFHINPPASPHHGGLWEAAVKSMKNHLKRVVGSSKLSMEEFITLLTQIESVLNSRPLTCLSTDPNDFEVLTPGHFLVGSSLQALPQQDLTDVTVNRLSRWQLVQQMFQHFWNRWSSEYLTTLQSRNKWFLDKPNVKEGLLVLVRDNEAAWGPLQWKLGRISKVYPGPDGNVRVCDVRTSSGAIYRRPIVKLSPLPIY